MRLIPVHAMLAVLCLAKLVAGEAPPPALSCFIPDLKRFEARLATHPCATAWGSAPAGAGETVWLAIARRATQLRGEFTLLPPHAGLPVCEATLALMAAEAAEPTPVTPLRSQRAGAWWLLGLSSRPLAVPGETRLSATGAGGDLLLDGHLPAWTGLLAPGRAEAWSRLLAAWAVQRIEVVVDLAEGGWADRTHLPGARLPLRAIEPEALAGVPADGLAYAVLACDGPALATQIQAVLAAAGGEAQALGQQLQEEYGVALADLAKSLDGTLSLSLHGPTTHPEFLCGLPLSPLLKDLLGRWLEKTQPEQGAILAEAATEQAVPFWWPGAGQIFVRLAHNRLWLSNAPRLLDACGADPAPPFPFAATWPGASGAVALLRWREGVLGNLVNPWRNAEGPLAAMMRACTASGSGIPAGSSVIHQDAQGLRHTGVQALAWAAPLLGRAQLWAAELARGYAQDCDRGAADNLRAILLRGLAFAKATGANWPRDLEDLRAWAKDLTDDRFANAGRPDLAQPFCYVSPLVDPPADQPILVQDPLANQGRGSWVGFADGRVLFKEGRTYWQEAQRLAALAAARNAGIEFGEWTTSPKTF